MKPLILSPAARRDLRSIASSIAEDNEPRALSFIRELRAKTEETARRPKSFRARDDIRPGLRSAVHGNYLIFFRELDEQVRLVRVVHGARDLASLTFD